MSAFVHRSAIVLAAVVLLGGCDESVTPILGTDRAFTLYGFLDPSADRQAIRVFPIEDLLYVADPVAIDARLTSRNMAGGPSLDWRDSIVAYVEPVQDGIPDTTWGTVFWAPFRAEFGARYEVVAARSDGAESRVVVTTPSRADVQIGEPSGVRSNMVLPVRYDGAARTLSTTVRYTVGTDGTTQRWTVAVTYEGREARDGGIEITVRLSGDLGQVYQRSGLRPGVDDIYLYEVVVETFVAVDFWNPPGGAFDPEILVEPGTFSNVENGFGFVGAGYTDRTAWPVDPLAAELAGYDLPPP